MDENERHIEAFEAYYASRNFSKVCRELHISRASIHKWKLAFHWKERCEERDNEINEQVHAVMMPQWVSTKTLLIQQLLNLINDAIKRGIAIETMAELTSAIRELRALFGEADRHEIISTVKHEITDDPDILKSANALAKQLSGKEQ